MSSALGAPESFSCLSDSVKKRIEFCEWSINCASMSIHEPDSVYCVYIILIVYAIQRLCERGSLSSPTCRWTFIELLVVCHLFCAFSTTTVILNSFISVHISCTVVTHWLLLNDPMQHCMFGDWGILVAVSTESSGFHINFCGAKACCMRTCACCMIHKELREHCFSFLSLEWMTHFWLSWFMRCDCRVVVEFQRAADT